MARRSSISYSSSRLRSRRYSADSPGNRMSGHADTGSSLHRDRRALARADAPAEAIPVGRGVRVRVIPDGKADEQAQAVVGVLLVELEDLELGQQQVQRIQRMRHQGQARGELERVAHVQLVDEHVDRQAGLGVGEVELLVAVK